MTRLAAAEVAALDPYKFMAIIGKTVIHPGGRASTQALLARARITAASQVLGVGCGVATTAIEIARRFGAHVTALGIPPPAQARQVFLGPVCPGMAFGTAVDWAEIYSSAGLVSVETQTGPFEMMTPGGFVADEGPARSLAIMARVAARPAGIRKMAWLMPRMAKAVPYLGYILVASQNRSRSCAGQPGTAP